MNDLDDIVEDVPMESKQKLYNIVNNKFNDRDVFDNIQQFDIQHIPKFNILLNNLSQYKEKEKILQYILLIDQVNKKMIR